jgi:hypothetical protein
MHTYHRNSFATSQTGTGFTHNQQKWIRLNGLNDFSAKWKHWKLIALHFELKMKEKCFGISEKDRP